MKTRYLIQREVDMGDGVTGWATLLDVDDPALAATLSNQFRGNDVEGRIRVKKKEASDEVSRP